MTLLEQLQLLRKTGRKTLAVLIDPEKPFTIKHLKTLLRGSSEIGFFLFGGSTASPASYPRILRMFREMTSLPLVIFPAHPSHVCQEADAVLLLSLISGRNPDFLIGHHVDAAFSLRRSGLEMLPTGYVLCGSDVGTAVVRVSGCLPITADDSGHLAASTALAGELLGLRSIYLEAGSGAARPVHPVTIRAVREATSLPLMVGGGIRSAGEAENAWSAGADIVVIGNALEDHPERIDEWTAALRRLRDKTDMNVKTRS